MCTGHFFGVLLRGLILLMNLLYIPLFIKRLFVRSKHCPHIEDNIIYVSATSLAEKIRKRQVSCEYVIQAYIKRISQVNPILNAIIEDRFEAAIEDAKRKDELLASKKLNEDQLRQCYPLFGVPLTVKGSIALDGLAFNAGSLVRDVKAAKDAVVVKLAKEAGAIPLLVSSTPELCMNWETTNKVIGTTKNPYDTTRTVGGSSGGECALLSSGASIIGLGSDIAGSLRLPAHFCGVWGHKPSPGAVSIEGHFPGCEHREFWQEVFTLGPLARYMDDLYLLFSCIIKPEIKSVLRLEEPVDLETIKVYYVEDQGSILVDKVNKNIRHALERVISHLNGVCKGEPEKLNHRLISTAAELSFLHLLSLDGIENVLKGQGEGVYQELFAYFTCRSKFTFVPICYGLYKRLLHRMFKNHIQNVMDDISDLKAFLIKLLDKNSVLICPSFTNEAHQHGDIYRKVFSTSYLSIFNSLGFPVTNCPVLFTKEGLPVGLQVAAAPNCDRLTLAVAKEIENAFGGWQAPDNQIPNIVT